MNFNKIRLLAGRQWLENRKSFAFFAIGIAGSLALLFLITWHWRDSFSGGVNKGIFLIGLFVAGALFGHSIFKDLGSHAKNIWHLALPASALEKLATALLYGFFIFLASYIILFYVVEGFHLWIINDKSTNVPHTDLFGNRFYMFVFTFIKFQLFILLGTLYFKKLALLKTIILLILLFFFSTNANVYFLKWMTGEESITSALPFDYFQFIYGGENVYVYLPGYAELIVQVLLDYCLPIALLYIIYVRFTETEV